MTSYTQNLIAVQTLLLGGGEAELHFTADYMQQEDGTLLLFAQLNGKADQMIMAFAPRTWRGAWIVDSTTQAPLGLVRKQVGDVVSTPSALPTSSQPHALKESSPPSVDHEPENAISTEATAVFAHDLNLSKVPNSEETAIAVPPVIPVESEPAEAAWPSSYEATNATNVPPITVPATIETPNSVHDPVSAPQRAELTTPSPSSVEVLSPTPTDPYESVVDPHFESAIELDLDEHEPMSPEDFPPAPLWVDLDKEERIERVASYLSENIYLGTQALALTLLAPEPEISTILSMAIGQRKISVDRVINAEVQTLLSQFVPRIIEEHRPQKPIDILEHLWKNPQTQAADIIQLRIWILHNPPAKKA